MRRMFSRWKEAHPYKNLIKTLCPAAQPFARLWAGQRGRKKKRFWSSEHARLAWPGDLGALDGLDFTAGGVMLNAQIRGDIPGKITVNGEGKIATTLALQPGGIMSDLNGPADLAVRRSADGAQLVVIPELYARDATAGDDEVTVLALPTGSMPPVPVM